MHLSVHLSPPPLPLFCSPLLFIYFSFFPNIHSLFPLLTHWMPRARCHLEKCVIFCLTFQPFLQGPISVLSKWIRTRVFFSSQNCPSVLLYLTQQIVVSSWKIRELASHSLHCVLLHAWFIWINIAAC